MLDDSQYFCIGRYRERRGRPRDAHRAGHGHAPSRTGKHRYATSLGYGTDTKARGKFTWDNRRVNRDGHRFKLELTRLVGHQGNTGRYVIPVMDVALEKLEFTGTSTKKSWAIHSASAPKSAPA